MSVDRFLNGLLGFFTSLRLTVACLALGLILVFAGTLAQVDLGLYRAQNEFFRSFIVFWGPKGASWRVPVLPGGYLLGGVLLINLIASLLTRFSLDRRKMGIWLVHIGLILLLLGQLLTDFLSRESALAFVEGETKNYSEDFRANELVLIDKSDPKADVVYSLPEKLLTRSEVRDPRLPLGLRVKKYWPNAGLVRPGTEGAQAGIASGATAGLLKDVLVVPQPIVSNMDQRNSPAAVVEIEDGKSSAGTFLVSSMVENPQLLQAGGRQYEIGLRLKRYYYPFSLTLLKATHEKYRGTEIPKNFASRVRVQNPQKNEARETVVYMNNPLRYSGLTFYQFQMAAGDMSERSGAAPSSTLQVVRNPSWLTPYLSCVLISLGLLVQFGSHLVGSVRRRMA